MANWKEINDEIQQIVADKELEKKNIICCKYDEKQPYATQSVIAWDSQNGIHKKLA